MGGAGEAGLFLEVELLRVGVLRARLLPLGDGQEICPVFDPQDVAGMAGAEKDEPREEATGVSEEVKQLGAGEVVAGAAGFGEFQQVQVSMPAPVDDVVAVVFPNLRLQPFARDAVREEVRDDAVVRVDFLIKEPQQFAPLLPGAQRTRTARFGEDKEHPQGLIGRQFHGLGDGGLHVVDDTDEEVALAQGGLSGAGARDFPRHTGQSGRKVVFLLRGSRQLNAQRPLGLRLPELLKDFLPEHLLRDADTDLGHRCRFFSFLHVKAQVVPQVEEALKVAGRDGLKVRLAVSNLRPVAVEQAELGAAVRVVSGDDEAEMSRHGDCWDSSTTRPD